jgi:hypothetical protein
MRKRRRVRGSPSPALCALALTKEWICPVAGCSQSFTREADVARHLATVLHNSDELSDAEVDQIYQEERDDSRRWCGFCFEILARADSRRRHETIYCERNPRAEKTAKKAKAEKLSQRSKLRAIERRTATGQVTEQQARRYRIRQLSPDSNLNLSNLEGAS